MKLYKHIIILTALLMVFNACKGKTEQSATEEESHEIIEDQSNHDDEDKHLITINQNQKDALKLKTGSLSKRNLSTVIKINGQLAVSPEDKAGVTTVIGGKVKSIKVFQGDKVKKGQILAILEHPDYIKIQEDFATTSNNLEWLKQEYERQKALYENNVGAGKDYQKAKTNYKNALIKYESLKAKLKLLNLSPEKVKNGHITNTINIVSPISGYVNDVNVIIGQYVKPDEPMFEITDNNKIHADFKVYEKDVPYLKIAQKIHFSVANKDNKEYTAQIFAIGKKFENDARAVHIHAKILDDKKGLIPGMYLSGHLHTDQKNVLALPNDAIVTEGLKSYIFVMDPIASKEQNTMVFKMFEVIKGQSDEGYTAVTPIEPIPKNAKIALNNAYYLLSDLSKDELGDDD